MEKITSLSNNYIKELMLLKNKKIRDEKKEFLVEGFHLVEEAKNFNKLKCVLITNENDKIDGVRNIFVNDAIISKLSSTVNPQKIIGVCHGGYLERIEGDRFVLLDNLQDPGNLGTIIRSALGFKIDQIIMSPTCCDCYNEKVVRSTQGGIFKVGLVKQDLLSAISELKNMGVTILGTSLTGEVFDKLPKLNKYAIILGNEANGVSSVVQEASDYNILIKTESALESLNVGVAGSIMMYEMYKSINK